MLHPDIRCQYSRLSCNPSLSLWVLGTLLTWWILSLAPDSELFLPFTALYSLFLITVLCYGFEIIEVTARGHQKAPPYRQAMREGPGRLMRLLVAISLALVLFKMAPDSLHWFVVMVLLAISPAVTSFITFREPLLVCINPVRIW
jgi:uncharacterized membrane protein